MRGCGCSLARSQPRLSLWPPHGGAGSGKGLPQQRWHLVREAALPGHGGSRAPHAGTPDKPPLGPYSSVAFALPRPWPALVLEGAEDRSSPSRKKSWPPAGGLHRGGRGGRSPRAAGRVFTSSPPQEESVRQGVGNLTSTDPDGLGLHPELFPEHPHPPSRRWRPETAWDWEGISCPEGISTSWTPTRLPADRALLAQLCDPSSISRAPPPPGPWSSIPPGTLACTRADDLRPGSEPRTVIWTHMFPPPDLGFGLWAAGSLGPSLRETPSPPHLPESQSRWAQVSGGELLWLLLSLRMTPPKSQHTQMARIPVGT